MKSWIPWLGAALVVGVIGLAWPRAVLSQGGATIKKDEMRTIVSTGSATVQVMPDAARIHFMVQTMKPGLKAGREENAQLVKRVMDALKGLGIPELKMKTSDVNVEIVYSHQPRQDRLPEVLGYRLSNSFTVKVTSQDREALSKLASKVLDTALEMGATNVQQISFFKEDDKATRHEALEKAVREATRNAESMAKGAGVRLIGPVTIVEQSESYRPYMTQNNVMFSQAAEATETPVSAGALEVTARVTITSSY